MKNSFLGYILAAILLTPFPAGAYEFLCGGYTVTGYDNSGCPQGEYDNGGNCGCSVNTAPKWQGGLLNMVVENQGNNTVSASQFVDIAQYAANAWSQISCSSAILNISGTIAATNNAIWGTDSSQQALYMVTGQQEWIQVTGSGAGGTLGVTLSPYGGWNCNNRSFSDSDIIINGFNGQGYSQLRSTVMHEMGHSLGSATHVWASMEDAQIRVRRSWQQPATIPSVIPSRMTSTGFVHFIQGNPASWVRPAIATATAPVASPVSHGKVCRIALKPAAIAQRVMSVRRERHQLLCATGTAGARGTLRECLSGWGHLPR